MTKEEKRLIQRAKRGDPQAFAEIYDRCQPPIYRYIFYRVKDESVAEDLTSEVFVRLVEKIDQFTYRGRPVLAWLYTIARNLITDHHRQSQKAPLPLLERIVSGNADPEQATQKTFTQERLTDAIAELTEGQRQVILLKFFEGLDNAATARILGKSVGAVKSLQHRGLNALHRILTRESDSSS